MKKILLLPFFMCLLFSNFSFAQKNNSGLQRVIIIRHGEKPDKGDNLSCQGLNRSLQLPEVLHRKFGVPDNIFVPSINNGKSAGTARMYQTIVPFAVKYKLNINTKFDVQDTKALAQELMKRSGTILLVWEHKNIDNIIRALGVNDQSRWGDEDYDSIWIISFKNGKAFLSKDKENIVPSAECR